MKSRLKYYEKKKWKKRRTAPTILCHRPTTLHPAFDENVRRDHNKHFLASMGIRCNPPPNKYYPLPFANRGARRESQVMKPDASNAYNRRVPVRDDRPKP
mmetsp:Transcript_22818/g.65819  ORF Transcript_22818/g.65819 Transcript_22818/m.65819 type:complete len:100 (+) Transcript_22818:752-1051(+)